MGQHEEIISWCERRFDALEKILLEHKHSTSCRDVTLLHAITARIDELICKQDTDAVVLTKAVFSILGITDLLGMSLNEWLDRKRKI